MSRLAVALLVLAACGTSEPEPAADGMPTPAPIEPTADGPSGFGLEAPVVPAPMTVEGEYPGSWEGLCMRLADCECSDWNDTAACATEIEAGFMSGIEHLKAMGLPDSALGEFQMTEDRLSSAANTDCPEVCRAASEFKKAAVELQ